MREIKFRGKLIDNGEWIYGYFTKNNNSGKCYITTQTKTGGAHPWEVDPETVGQYTGLKDKNGVEIYEGDILKDERGAGEVKWLQGHCAFIVRTIEPHPYNHLESGNLRLKSTEIIGNIYENPELLLEVE